VLPAGRAFRRPQPGSPEGIVGKQAGFPGVLQRMPGRLPAEYRRCYRRNKTIGDLAMTLNYFLTIALGIVIICVAMAVGVTLMAAILKIVLEFLDYF
jgi:hypothetical protein